MHARKIVFWFLFIFFFFSFPIFIWFLIFELISFCRLKTENRFCLECFGEDQRAKGENLSAEADDDAKTLKSQAKGRRLLRISVWGQMPGARAACDGACGVDSPACTEIRKFFLPGEFLSA